MNSISASIPAPNRPVLSVYEIDQLNNVRRRELDRSKIEDKTIVQIVVENYQDARVITTKEGDFIEGMAGLENVQFYWAKRELSTGKIIQIGLPATKDSDGSVYFPGANELKVGKDLFDLNGRLRSQGFEWVLIGKDETNNSKFNINDDLKINSDSVITQLFPYFDPKNFDAGHENLRNAQDSFFGTPVDNFCISCGGGAKKEKLDIAKADYSAATTSDSPNTYSLAAVDLYCGENNNLISLDHIKLIPPVLVVPPVLQQSQQNPQFSLISRNMDINKTDGGFFLAWNAVSYAETYRNATTSYSLEMAKNPLYVDQTPDSVVACSAKTEQDPNQIFDAIQNLKFFHIADDVRVADTQKSELLSGCSNPDVPKQYIVKLSPFSKPEESQLMRLLMNPTERKLWGKLFGLPDEDDARQISVSELQHQKTSRISLSVSKVVSQSANISSHSPNKIPQSSSQQPQATSAIPVQQATAQAASVRVPHSTSQVLQFTSPFSAQKPECKAKKEEKKGEKKEETKQGETASPQGKPEDKKSKKDSDEGKGAGKTASAKDKSHHAESKKKPFDFLGILRKDDKRKLGLGADEDEEDEKKGNGRKQPKENKKNEKNGEKPVSTEKQKPEIKKQERKDLGKLEAKKQEAKKIEDAKKEEAKKDKLALSEENKNEKKLKLTEKEKTERKLKLTEERKEKKLKLTEDKEEKKNEIKKNREKTNAQPAHPEKKEYGFKKSVSSNTRPVSGTASKLEKQTAKQKKIESKTKNKKRGPSFLLRWILERRRKRRKIRKA